VAVLLAAFLIYYFFVSNGSWMLPVPNRPKTLGKTQLNVRVWTDKSTGFYYCPDNRFYGRIKSGRYMSQGEALQDGYTPALHELCR
jgi:hypothetical protein